jgi:hypothetical protein
MGRSWWIVALALALSASVACAERGTIVGTVVDVRSELAVPVHPVVVIAGKDVIARTLTDRLGKFKLEFAYTRGQALTIKTTTTTAYLEAQGAVDPDTEVAIKVMPRWATILGIVTDKATGRGVPDVPVSLGRGDKVLADSSAHTKTDATGVYMLKVVAFDGDDVTHPVRDLWVSVNDGEGANPAYASVQTDVVPLWAWQDATEPTKVEVSLPGAHATGFTLADLVTVKAPEAVAGTAPATPTQGAGAGGATTGAAPAGTAPGGTSAAGVAASGQQFTIICPYCGQKITVIVPAAQ